MAAGANGSSRINMELFTIQLQFQKAFFFAGLADSVNERREEILGHWRENPVLPSVNKIGSNNSTTLAKTQRDLLCAYFNSPQGSVPWQESYVYRGSLPTN